MSKLSIFEPAWIDIVFENKNKDYGAYQLRRENPKTTIKALFIALILVTVVISIQAIFNAFGSNKISQIKEFLGPTITPFDYPLPPKTDPPAKSGITPPVNTSEPKPQQSLENAQVTKNENAATDVLTNDQRTEQNTVQGTDNGVPTDNTSARAGALSPGTGNNEPDANTAFETAVLDKMPMYPGGMKDFYAQVGKRFRVPEDDLGSGNTIRVLMSFVIEKDGTMTEINVLQNPGYGIDREAIRVLKSMKAKWEPGSIGGKAVRVAYKLPISVKIP